MSRHTKILVIDDAVLIRAMAEAVLKQAGYDVRTAADGAEGRELWSEWHPDGVFLDLTLPDESGWDILSEMKATPGMGTAPIYILSGEDDPDVAELAVLRGAAGFIHKPFTSDQLLDALSTSIPSP